MNGNQHVRMLIEEIADHALKTGREISWFCDPLTPGRGRLYLLQHIPRSRLLSSVLRPAWMSRSQGVSNHCQQEKKTLTNSDLPERGGTLMMSLRSSPPATASSASASSSWCQFS